MPTMTIPTDQIGQPTYRGVWATAAVDEFGVYGILIGRYDDASALTLFVREDQFAEVRAALGPDLQSVFDGAVRRLPQFKLSQRRQLQ